MSLAGSQISYLFPCLPSHAGVVIILDRPADYEDPKPRLSIGRFWSAEVLGEGVDRVGKTGGLGAAGDLTDLRIKRFGSVPLSLEFDFGLPVEGHGRKPVAVP